MIKNNKIVVILSGFFLMMAHLLSAQFVNTFLHVADIFKLHLFLILLSYVVISALIKVKSADNDKVGFAFLAGVTVKLILGTLYFYFFLPKNKFIVLQFILFYLIYLFIETFLAFKIISSQPIENQDEK